MREFDEDLGRSLYILVRDFIENYGIVNDDSIFQVETVYGECPLLVSTLCDVVGYVEDEE